MLPLRYHTRNVLLRWRSTLATVLGVALVVAVYLCVQALAAGLEKSSGNTGDPRNLLIVRKGALAESTSIITREQYRQIMYLDAVARDAEGKPLTSSDVLIIINLQRTGEAGSANASLRGVSPNGLLLRSQVKLVDGRWFEAGKREVVTSRRMADRFESLQMGRKFKAAGQEFTVVGLFDGQRSAFDSEVWLDCDEAREVFDRPDYSSILVRPIDDPSALKALSAFLENDKRLKVKVVKEVDYYKEQTRTAMPIKVLGNFLATTMSIGAVFAAMNTMYASIGARTREIGTLRVLGYRRRTILLGFMIEGVFLATIGGLLGCLIAWPMNGYSTGTISFENFSEVVFDFIITPELYLKGILFSMTVGLIGSLLPAIRAARLPVITSLKSI